MNETPMLLSGWGLEFTGRRGSPDPTQGGGVSAFKSLVLGSKGGLLTRGVLGEDSEPRYSVMA